MIRLVFYKEGWCGEGGGGEVGIRLVLCENGWREGKGGG